MKPSLLILLLFVLCCCGRKSANEINNNGSVTEVDLLSEPGSTVKKLSEIASEVKYVPLQTIAGSLMGNIIKKIVKIGDRIYVQNIDEILCFNMEGKFLFKLENTGRGPEEYSYIEDFDVSSDDKNLALLSGKKLLFYDISASGFHFQRSITLKDPAPYRVSTVPETDNLFLAIPPWAGNEATLSLLINTNGDTIHYKPNCYQYENVRKANFRASNESILYTSGDNVCFKERFSDTVFYINANENYFRPRIIFNSHGTTMTPEMRGGSEPVGNNTTFIANIFGTPRYVFYYYMSADQTRNRLFFDRKTNTRFKINIESELKDDLSGGPDFNIEFLNSYCSGGSLFSLVDALTLKKYIASDDFIKAQVKEPKKKDALKRLDDSLKETDNPVLVMVKLKE